MNKSAIEKIIRNNRFPIAVHQLWAEFDRLKRQNKAMAEALETCTRHKAEGYDYRGMNCWYWKYHFDEAKVAIARGTKTRTNSPAITRSTTSSRTT